MNKILEIELKHLKKINVNHIDTEHATLENVAELVRRGIFIEPLIPINTSIKNAIIERYGFDFKNANSTFYKTYEERFNKPWLEVVLERLIHYASSGEIIPNEVDDLVYDYVKKNFVKIQIVEEQKIKEDLTNLVSSPFALPTNEINSFFVVLNYYKIEEITGNKELQIKFAAENKRVLKDHNLFLRELYYLLSGETTLIKSKNNLANIYGIRSFLIRNNYSLEKIEQLILEYKDKYGLLELAKHFRPNKKLWLIIRHNVPAVRPIINKIKRLSEKVHVDHTPKLVTEYTDEEINKMNVYQLIKAFNYVRENRRITKSSFFHNGYPKLEYVQAYKVRNGRVYVKKKDCKVEDDLILKLFATEVKITNRLREIFKDSNKKIYLKSDDSVSIKMPTSGKSFIGNYPMFTSVTTDKNRPYQVGFYWNVHCDLDLHTKSITGNHVGFYGEGDSNVVYSGDMIDLNKHGFAAESMLIKESKDSSYTFSLQPYSVYYNTKPEATIFVATSTDINYKRDDIVKPEEVVFSAKIPADKPYTFAVSVDEKLILTNLQTGGRLPDEETAQLLIEAIIRKEQAAMTIHEFSDITGIEITEEIDEDTIDFTSEKVSTNSFIELLTV